MKIPFMEQVFETDNINQEAQYKIASAGCCIAEGLQFHYFPEWRVKKIYDGQDKIPGGMYVTTHGCAKVKAKSLNRPACRQAGKRRQRDFMVTGA
jgi:hypothetical protein